MTKKQKVMAERIVVAIAMVIALQLVQPQGMLRFVLYMINYSIIGYDILKKAFKGIVHGQVFDECFLMAVATIGAIFLGIHSGSHDYLEAVAVMLFYQIGEWFQSYAVGKSRASIAELMDIRPDTVHVLKNNELVEKDAEDLQVGDQFIVQPGEKIAIDGVVISGQSALNMSALTGESLPKNVASGDEVISGSININGMLTIQATKLFDDSTAAKILELVENATANKAKSEAFIAKFARYYTPFVCYSALALALLPPVIAIIMGNSPLWEVWLYRALTFLVISCPCALVISIPLSFFAGIGGASKAGILVKGSNYLERLSQTKIAVFDKTGTLTQGVFEVVAIHHNTMDDHQLLEYAALAESGSSHPIAKSLMHAYNEKIDQTRVKDVKEVAGKGIVASVDNHVVACGNEALMEYVGANALACHSIGTIVHVAIDGEYEGHIVISDVVKPSSGQAMAALHEQGVQSLVMLTGDRENVANKVAKDLGLDSYHAQLLPQDKVAKVEQLMESKAANQTLLFVGDGINDAPVLALADVGIAMGALGSDAAIEAADVVIMDDDPLKVSEGIAIARKCMRIVYQNIYFAIGIKFACLFLGAIGIGNMWTAIFADVGVMVLAILNSMRALHTR